MATLTPKKNSDRTHKDTHAFDRGGNHPVTATVVRVLVLGLTLGIAVALSPALFGEEQWLFLAIVWAVTAVVVVVYATPKFIPAKYLTPGTLLLVLFLIVPIGLTIQLSFTNFGDGTRGTKEEAVARIVATSVQQTPDAPAYGLSFGTEGSTTEGPFVLFLVPQDDPETAFRGDEEGLEEVTDEVTIDAGATPLPKVTEADGFTILTGSEVNDAGDELLNLAVPTEDDTAIRPNGISTAFEGTTRLQYDEGADTITDTASGTVYTVQQVGDRELFVDEAGEPVSDLSWKANVGFANYERLFTSDTIRNDFIRIFIWTLVFATLSVVTTFGLGLFLAVTFNDPRMKFQKVYRALLILPYAIPGVIALLLWSSFWNRDFGLVNSLTGLSINWLGNEWAAKVAVIVTNLWMGFPYMFLVCTGALQSISGDLKEAATIDGASGWQNFRKITFPLLLVSVAPLLVATFAFNFNNYNVIALLTEGGPFSPDNPAAGGTDILISYTMRLAFGAGGAQIGFASAVSVVLFIITGVLAAIQFRATRGLEDVN